MKPVIASTSAPSSRHSVPLVSASANDATNGVNTFSPASRRAFTPECVARVVTSPTSSGNTVEASTESHTAQEKSTTIIANLSDTAEVAPPMIYCYDAYRAETDG